MKDYILRNNFTYNSHLSISRSTMRLLLQKIRVLEHFTQVEIVGVAKSPWRKDLLLSEIKSES